MTPTIAQARLPTRPRPEDLVTEPAVNRLFIAGRWTDSVSSATFDSVNPADTSEKVR